MADTKKQLDRMLTENRFELVRQDRHLIYRQRITGLTLVLSKTPSDHRWSRNALRDLKKLLAGNSSDPSRRSSVLEQMKADQLIRSYQPPPPVARKGKGSKGTGFKYIDKIVPVLTPEQKVESEAASMAAKERCRLAKIERKQREAFIESCVEFVRIELEEAMVETDRIVDYMFENFYRLENLLLRASDEEFVERTTPTLAYEDKICLHFLSDIVGDLQNAVGDIDKFIEERGGFKSVMETSRSQLYGAKYKEAYLREARRTANGDRIQDVRGPHLFSNLWVNACNAGLAKWHQSMAIVKYTLTR